MAATRGRGLGSAGQAFSPWMVDGATGIGQPTMIRMQGVPTMPGYRDRPGKWNVLLPPFVALAHAIRELIERIIS